ncbi:hypothetical protein CRYUN_Cryun20dG0124100 [Craigia yunnanensis]
MLVALANTGIRVIVSIPISNYLALANQIPLQLIGSPIVAHYPATNMTTICVGSEVLTPLPNTLYFSSLSPTKEAVDSNTLVHYSNVFDAMFDTTYFAMAFLNFTNIVTETSWPSKGDSNEPDATIENANTYNSSLICHVINKIGTPKHPGIAVSTYIYELYNEDMKPGPISEKNWGLFDANGDPIYILRLTGSGSLLANDTVNQTYCIAKDGADPKMLQAALDWA